MSLIDLLAAVVELVDTQDLKSCSFGSVGSIPTRGTSLRSYELRLAPPSDKRSHSLDLFIITMDKILKKTAMEFMTKEVIAVREDEGIKQIFKLLDESGTLGVPVVDDQNHVIGIITETDLIKHFTTLKTPRSINLLGGIVYLDDITEFNEHLKDQCADTVKDLMFESVITIQETTTLQEMLNIMSDKQITRLPVVDKKNELVGIITRTDIVHQLAKVKKI